MRMRWFGVGVCLFSLAAAQARPQAAPKQLDSMEMTGSIGPYPVGLNYTTQNNTELVTAHYFYLSQDRDIALSGAVHGQDVDWTGADGGTFHLHFVGNGSEGKAPLNFYNSIGLTGTWTQGARTLPVKLTGSHSTTDPGEPMYADVTSAPDAAFEAMVRQAVQAIASGDAQAAARFVDFPLEVNVGKQRLEVKTGAALKADWSRIFTPGMVARFHTESTHEMFVHDGMATPGDGELWFNAKGLTSVNVF